MLIPVCIESYEGDDSSLLVNGDPEGKMWVIVDTKDPFSVDCGYPSEADALSAIRASRARARRTRRAFAQ